MEEQPVALPGVPQPRMGARQPVDDPAVLKAAEVGDVCAVCDV
jgi:hypothetical protein